MMPDPDFALSRSIARQRRQQCRTFARGALFAAVAAATIYWLAWIIAT